MVKDAKMRIPAADVPKSAADRTDMMTAMAPMAANLDVMVVMVLGGNSGIVAGGRKIKAQE